MPPEHFTIGPLRPSVNERLMDDAVLEGYLRVLGFRGLAIPVAYEGWGWWGYDLLVAGEPTSKTYDERGKLVDRGQWVWFGHGATMLGPRFAAWLGRRRAVKAFAALVEHRGTNDVYEV